MRLCFFSLSALASHKRLANSLRGVQTSRLARSWWTLSGRSQTPCWTRTCAPHTVRLPGGQRQGCRRWLARLLQAERIAYLTFLDPG